MDGLSRRRLLVVGGMAALPGLLVPRGGRMSVAPEALDDFEFVTRQLTDLYAITPLEETARQINRELPIVRGLLRDGNLTTEGQRRMHAVAGRLTALLGMVHLGIGWSNRAAQALGNARVHAALADDRVGQAWCCFLLTSREQHGGRPGAGLDYARQGLTIAPVGSPVAARLASEGEAFSLAAMGERKHAVRALDRAWRTVDTFGLEQRGMPGWHPHHFHPAELDEITAATYLDLGNPGAALVHVEQGISQLDRTNALGHRAYIRVDAAMAMLAQGEGEQAVAYMSQALDVSKDRKLADIGGLARKFIARGQGKAPAGHLTVLAQQVRHWESEPEFDTIQVDSAGVGVECVRPPVR